MLINEVTASQDLTEKFVWALSEGGMVKDMRCSYICDQIFDLKIGCLCLNLLFQLSKQNRIK